jgi:protein arginine kinase
LSLLRLGVDLGFFTQVTYHDLNRLFLLIQPAHLQKLYDRALGASERDVKRADLIRETLKGVPL